jgi:hypothetical protein
MQSEDLDKKIRDAAEHHHPAYNEAAWSKMKDLLDKHLPQEKKDKRRILFFLLFLLLLGGGTWIIISKPWQPQQQVVKTGSNNYNDQANNNPANQKPGNSASIPDNGTGATKPVIELEKNVYAPTPGNNSNTGVTPEGTKLGTPGDFSITVSPEAKSRKGKKVSQDDGSTLLNKSPDPVLVTRNNKDPIPTGITPDKGITNKDEKTVVAEVQKTIEPTLTPARQAQPNLPTLATGKEDTVSRQSITAKDNQTLVVIPKEEVPKKKEKKKRAGVGGFVFSLSAGPDISAAGLDDMGKLQPVYGVGLGYRLSEKFTLRTGMYVASKIYTASPSDYKPEYTPPNFNYLQKVDADCRVYEIPVTLAYQWGKRNHQWFASAGVSSYLMKRETYDYLYKYPSGQTYSYRRIIENENKHFLSAISLSSGYTRKLNNTFSISAEPYIKIPVSGVGWGNINLQSGGVLFSINAFIPTSKKKK